MAITNLILFFRYPHTNYYTVPVLVIAKLYCNTLLVLFNSRMRIVGGREEDPGHATVDLHTRGWQMPTFNHPASVYMEEHGTTTPVKDEPSWAAGWNLSRLSRHGEVSVTLRVSVGLYLNLLVRRSRRVSLLQGISPSGMILRPVRLSRKPVIGKHPLRTQTLGRRPVPCSRPILSRLRIQPVHIIELLLATLATNDNMQNSRFSVEPLVGLKCDIQQQVRWEP